ncbi:SRPBCC family protein [Thiohalorhabdus sp.]|uniref:SRPBCC family protein n=1 Tax=Thiohalorhabdus sp. TaxID=3094134 RepID=UPI002FC36618
MLKKIVAIIALLAPLAAAGASVEELNVAFRDGAYRAQMVAQLEASPRQVRRMLTDFDNLERINASVKESEVVAPNSRETSVRVRTRVRNCLAIFCQELTRVEAVKVSRYTIRSRIIPEKSDFEEGKSLWLITPSAGGTRLEVRLHMVPESELPTFAANLMARDLEDKLRQTLARIEQQGSPADPERSGSRAF